MVCAITRRRMAVVPLCVFIMAGGPHHTRRKNGPFGFFLSRRCRGGSGPEADYECTPHRTRSGRRRYGVQADGAPGRPAAAYLYGRNAVWLRFRLAARQDAAGKKSRKDNPPTEKKRVARREVSG